LNDPPYTKAPVPVGPYTGGLTGSIVTVAPNGTVSPVAPGLPSSSTSPDLGGLTSGVADVDFIGNTLYARSSVSTSTSGGTSTCSSR
jgi:hypothetical protein